MRVARLVYSAFMVSLFLLYSTRVEGQAICADSSDDDDDENDVVVKNPNYVGKISVLAAPSDDESDDDAEDTDESEEYGMEAKTAIEKALFKSKKLPKQALKVFRKHRLEITIVVALVAFRREIGLALYKMFSEPIRDPGTGEIVARAIAIRPTSVLKLVVFIDVMRRLQTNKVGKGTPLLAFLLLAGSGNPIFVTLLSKLLAPSNPAYIPPIEQHFTFERLNERYQKDGMALQKAIDPSITGDSPLLSGRNMTLANILTGHQATDKPATSFNDTLIIMDMTEMDSSVSQMKTLRDEVSFLLSNYRTKAMDARHNATNEPAAELEVVVILESPGGSASDYALASQQILRLRNEPGIKVTICVDKVAASGGYMIACTSSPGRLFAAPFAVLGSIGVIGQTVNIQKTLEGWGIQPLVFRGGRDKAPVGLIGEVTTEGLEKVQGMVDDTHRAFKRHVASARPVVAARIEELATGDTWLGYDALDVGLIDRIVTSDEYIAERMTQGARVLKLVQLVRPRYPFSRPTTASQLSQSRLPGSRSLFAALDDLGSLMDRMSKTLSRFVVDDLDTFPKTMAANDIRLSGQGCSM